MTHYISLDSRRRATQPKNGRHVRFLGDQRGKSKESIASAHGIDNLVCECCLLVMAPLIQPNGPFLPKRNHHLRRDAAKGE